MHLFYVHALIHSLTYKNANIHTHTHIWSSYKS